MRGFKVLSIKPIRGVHARWRYLIERLLDMYNKTYFQVNVIKPYTFTWL